MHITTTPGQDTLIADIAALRGLQQAGRYPEALHHARQLLSAHPGNRDLLLIEASSLRNLGRVEESLASCARLEAVAPQFSLMHQERGFCHVLRHDAPSAIAALSVAVRINPALPQSWRMLEAVYRIIGDTANATFAARQQDALKALPGPLLEGTSLFSDGDLERAEEMAKAYIRTGGNHPEAPRLLAKISRRRGNNRAARRYLAEVLTILPDHPVVRLEYVEALVSCRRHAEAEAVLAPLLNTADRGDDETAFRISTQRAVIAMSAGRYDEVITICRGLLDRAPQPFSGQAARTRLSMLLADAFRTIGDADAAIAVYRALIDARSDYGYAYWCLADLKTYRFSDADIAQMRAALAAETTSATDRVGLSFALGKAMEDRNDPEAAWFFYNAHRGQSRYRPDHDAAEATAIKRTYGPAFFAQRRDWGDAGADPIFVVGLTRGGSSLIEQILASHPQVEGLGELPNIPTILEDLQPDGPDPERIARLTASEARELGQRYLAETRMCRVTDRPRFVDKLPRNFRNIGFIHLILPNARIIDARRSPMACCFSNFRQLFGVAHLDNGPSYSYDLAGVGRQYRIYLDLMKHWQATLPDKIMLMIHEDLVADPEGQIRRLLAACDLPFANECLAFHQNRRAVRTPSAQQVRQPINRDGVDGWRAFEAWLDPLKLALGDALQTWRD